MKRRRRINKASVRHNAQHDSLFHQNQSRMPEGSNDEPTPLVVRMAKYECRPTQTFGGKPEGPPQ